MGILLCLDLLAQHVVNVAAGTVKPNHEGLLDYLSPLLIPLAFIVTVCLAWILAVLLVALVIVKVVLWLR